MGRDKLNPYAPTVAIPDICKGEASGNGITVEPTHPMPDAHLHCTKRSAVQVSPLPLPLRAEAIRQDQNQDCRGTERPATTRRRSVVESRHDRHPRPTAIVPPAQWRGRGGVAHESVCLDGFSRNPPQVGDKSAVLPQKMANTGHFIEAGSHFSKYSLSR